MKKLPLLFILVTSVCFGQTIKKFDPLDSNQNLNNVHFALPKTIVQVSIEADKTTSKVPEDTENLNTIFTDDALKLIPRRLTNEVMAKIDKVSIKTHAVPDENHIYQIITDKKFNKRNTIGVSVSNSGLITGASIESTDLTLKFITSLLVLAATIPVSADALNTKTFDPDTHVDILFEILKRDHFKNNIGNSNGKKLKVLIDEKQKLQDSLNKYDKILKKLENDVIFRNQYPNGLDKTVYRIKRLEKKTAFWGAKLNQKKGEFKKIIEKLMGTVIKSKETVVYELPWQFPSNSNMDIIKTLKKQGNSDDLELADLTQGQTFSNCLTCLKFELKRTNKAIGSRITDNFTGTNFSGMPFKVPESYEVIVYSKDKELGKFDFIAAGKHGRLDSSLKIESMEYYEQLGWIKSFKSSNKTIETSEIDSLGSSLYSVVGKAKGKSELELLTEETTLLELQLKKLKTEAEIKGILNPDELIIEENEE